MRNHLHCFNWSLILFFFFSSSVSAQVRPDSVLKVLAVGNSFSEDAVEQYLHELADASGKELVIGNLYIGGAPLSLHLENSKEDKEAYRYRKIPVKGEMETRQQVSLRQALEDEDWDFVSLQQASPLSGVFESYAEPINGLKHYIDSLSSEPVRYLFHQTWAYAPTSTHEGFARYNNNQIQMYKAIMKASGKVKQLIPGVVIIPSGTAIQNARTSSLGSDLTRDGYHLNLAIGRFIAACTWFETLFGQEAPIDQYRPENVSEKEAEIARKAADAASKKPFKITKINE